MKLPSGITVIVSPMLPTEKTLSWRNERKWCHRVMHRRSLAHKIRSKQVPSYDAVRMGSMLFVNQATFERIEAEIPSLTDLGRGQ